MSTGVQASSRALPGVGTAGAWRGKWLGLRMLSPHYRPEKEGWSLPWSSWSCGLEVQPHLEHGFCVWLHPVPQDGFVMGTEIGAVGRALENVHSPCKLKEQLKAIWLLHNSFFKQIFG